MELNVIINSGSSIIQTFYEKKGSTLKDEYRQSAAVAYMDKNDMEKLSLKPKDKILIKSKWGEVTVFVDISHDMPHEGVIFIPKGPWANMVISPETYCCNVPTFKGIEAVISKTDNEVLLLSKLIHKTYNKYSYNNDVIFSDKPFYKKQED